MKGSYIDHELRIQLISAARQVRAWTEARDDSLEYPSEDLNGWCAIASGQLSRLLHTLEINHEIHIAECPLGCHVYIVVNDHIIDITATQFQKYRNEPVLFEHRALVSGDWFYKPMHVFENADALREHQVQNKWHRHQIAYSKYLEEMYA